MIYNIDAIKSFIPNVHRNYATDIVTFKCKHNDDEGKTQIQLSYNYFGRPHLLFIKLINYQSKLRDLKLKELGI